MGRFKYVVNKTPDHPVLDKPVFTLLHWMDMNQYYIHLTVFTEDILIQAFIKVSFHIAFCKNHQFCFRSMAGLFPWFC
jgi:hypothetical protein